MVGVPVRLAEVSVDPPYTKCPRRVRYRVTLACGCFWWEDHPSDGTAPAVGRMLTCGHPHSQPIDSVAFPSTREIAPVPTQQGVRAVAVAQTR